MSCPACGADRPGVDVACPSCGAAAVHPTQTPAGDDAEPTVDAGPTVDDATDASAGDADDAAAGHTDDAPANADDPAAGDDDAIADAAAAAAAGTGIHPPPPDAPAPTAPPSLPLDPPTLDLGALPPEQGVGVEASSGEGSSGGAGQPPPGVDTTPSGDAPGPAAMPSTPPGSSSGRGRMWFVVAVGVALLVVVGAGALAVGLLAGSDPDDPPAAAMDNPAAPVTDADPPGTDAAMDELWGACADGDMQACDDLFVQSEVGSDYEEFGRTCGGRIEDALLCVEAFGGADSSATEGGAAGLPEAGPDATPPGTDAAMDELWAACADEDWQSCDDLFFESTVGSEYEDFGRTCGYRIDEAFLCTEDMTDGEDDHGGGEIPGTGPDGAATVAPATDEELDELWNACQGEDWQACDRLYFESEPQSDYEFFGATCGARDLLDGGGQLCQVLHAEPDDPPVVLPTDLVRGMCFDEPDEATVVFWLQTVPCEDGHDVEVMGVATLPRGPIPDDMAAAAVELCLPIFDEFVGVAYAASQLDIYHLSPTPESWALGDREVACGVYDPEGPVEGSLKGSGG